MSGKKRTDTTSPKDAPSKKKVKLSVDHTESIVCEDAQTNGYEPFDHNEQFKPVPGRPTKTKRAVDVREERKQVVALKTGRALLQGRRKLLDLPLDVIEEVRIFDIQCFANICALTCGADSLLRAASVSTLSSKSE